MTWLYVVCAEGVEEKERKAVRGAGVVLRVRTALKHARDAGGRRSSDWKRRDAMVPADGAGEVQWPDSRRFRCRMLDFEPSFDA